MRPMLACLFGLALTTPALAGIAKNPFNDRVLKLSPVDRAGALNRAVVDSGERCGRLTTSLYRGLHGNLGMWNVRCKPGGDYAVFLGPDASVQVRSCADVATLKLPACAKLD